jgi:hypothetical protein
LLAREGGKLVIMPHFSSIADGRQLFLAAIRGDVPRYVTLSPREINRRAVWHIVVPPPILIARSMDLLARSGGLLRATMGFFVAPA